MSANHCLAADAVLVYDWLQLHMNSSMGSQPYIDWLIAIPNPPIKVNILANPESVAEHVYQSLFDR